mmetsp:Transcript_150/g.139  ORF Transcript_150/g.139 Transcript_150/m.139 type:complete len:92 (+) Transcript_150:1306-1581(+)
MIPDRFNPESEYFFLPGKPGERRPQLSYTPFSLGPRICPGQILANLEAKYLIAIFTLKMDYDIPKEQLERDDMMFSIISHQRIRLEYKGAL